MGWEFGPEGNFAMLIEYEWRLEELFRRQPALCGICQYHRDTLPKEAMRHGVLMHPSIFVRTNGSIAHTGNQSDSIAIRTELRPLCIMTASGAIWSTELHFSSLFGVRSFWPRRSLPPLIEHPAELDVGVVALRGLLTLGTQPSVDSKG